MSWRFRWQAYEFVRNSLWIVPGLFVVLAIAMGIVLPDVDEGSTTRLGLAFGSGAAEAVLGSIAGGMITFTGFVFSILLLAVQFGSSQFSPRLLRRFLRSPTTKIALGVFIATFIYALMVLRTVGESDDPRFVPNNSITVALWWLLLSMVMFLLLISRTTQGLRVAAVVRELGRSGAKVIRRCYADPIGDEATARAADDSRPQPGADHARVVPFRGRPGVLQSVDAKGLVRAASDADVVVELVPAIGDALVPDTPLFRVHGSGAVDDKRLGRSVAVGDERTMDQDPAFVLRLLSDISSKALSPGINDPTTSVQSLDQIELLLRLLAVRRLTPGERRDAAGVVRLRYHVQSWDDFLSIALDEARAFGATSTQVTRRLRALLEDLRAVVPTSRVPAVEAQLELLDATVARVHEHASERTIAATADRQGLGSSRPPPPGSS